MLDQDLLGRGVDRAFIAAFPRLHIQMAEMPALFIALLCDQDGATTGTETGASKAGRHVRRGVQPAFAQPEGHHMIGGRTVHVDSIPGY